MSDSELYVISEILLYRAVQFEGSVKDSGLNKVEQPYRCIPVQINDLLTCYTMPQINDSRLAAIPAFVRFQHSET